MGSRVLFCCFLLQNTDYKNSLLFTPQWYLDNFASILNLEV